MSTQPKRKPAATEPGGEAAAEILKSYVRLMRAAGSPNGHWNPEPDEHITGMLRHDVELSPNEIKLVNLVKFCCSRQKALSADCEDFGQGRTLWGWTETGKPLRLGEIRAFFGWDWGNADKYSRRPLAYGFVRKNADGQFGIGARVQGKFTPPPPDNPSSKVDELVCTDKLPRYLAAEVVQRFGPPDLEKFRHGWRQIKQSAQQRLNNFKKDNYEREQDELSEHCSAFQLELKRKNGQADDEPEDADVDLSVQTSSVQNGGEPLYNGPNGAVHEAHIRRHSTAQSSSMEHSSSSSELAPAEAAKTTTTEKTFLIRLAKALRDHRATPDGEAIHELIAECRKKSADCVIEEIEHFVHEKARAMPRSVRNAMAWFKTAVPKCFDPESLAAYRESVAAAAAEQERLRTEMFTPSPANEKKPSPRLEPSQPPLTPEQIADLERQRAEAEAWLAELTKNNADVFRITAAKKELRRLESALLKRGDQ